MDDSPATTATRAQLNQMKYFMKKTSIVFFYKRRRKEIDTMIFGFFLVYLKLLYQSRLVYFYFQNFCCSVF